jgi:hypothetical protein
VEPDDQRKKVIVPVSRVAAAVACILTIQLGTAGVGSARPAAGESHAASVQGSGIYFDGRATRIGLLATAGQTGESNEATGWACLCFMNNAITVQKDPRFGLVYNVLAGPGYHSPYLDSGPLRAFSEVSASRPVRLGKWDWYADSVKLLPGFSTSQLWGLVADFNYPTISHSPLEIDYDFAGVGIARDVGYFATQYGNPPIRDVRRFWPKSAYPSLIGKWIDWVIGVKWATNRTGELRVYTRCGQCRNNKGWRLRYSLSASITMQWGAGIMNADGTSPQTGAELMTLDKMGLYYGYTTLPPSGLPTNRVLEMGIVRAATRSAAMGVFPTK